MSDSVKAITHFNLFMILEKFITLNSIVHYLYKNNDLFHKIKKGKIECLH